jgi:hypothetical protein
VGKHGHRHDGGNVKDNDGFPEDWSDDRLRDEYLALTADPREGSDQGGPGKSAITEEILRRGLTLPDTPVVPETEAVDWSGEAGGEDPGSGALPTAF